MASVLFMTPHKSLSPENVQVLSANVLKEDNLSALSNCQRKRLRATGHFMAANSTCQSPYKHELKIFQHFKHPLFPRVLQNQV